MIKMECKQIGVMGVNDNLRGLDSQRSSSFVDRPGILKHSFCSGLNKIQLSHHRRN
jgi:hypothetical protein